MIKAEPAVPDMNGQPRRIVRFILAGVVLAIPIFLVALACFFLVAPACSRTPNPRKQVEKMLAAHNRHDVAGELSLFTEDAEFVIPSQAPATGKAALRELFQADSVMNSELTYRGITVVHDTVFVDSVTERNDILRLLGLPAIDYTPGTKISFRAGLIRRIEVTSLDPKQFMAMQTAFRELMVWLRTAHPELLQDVQSGWLSTNTARSAEGWIKLATEWRESRANDGE
jgi:hypothetical protein